MKKTIYIYIGGIALGLGLAFNAAFGAFAPVSSPAIGTGAASNTILITNGTSSRWVATSTLGLGGAGVTISGGVLEAVISSNSTTTVTASVTAADQPLRVVPQGKYVYVGARGTGATFQTFVISTTTPSLINSFTSSSGVSGLAIRGNYAYIVENSGLQFEILNISYPKNPYSVTTISMPNSMTPYQVFISSHYLFVTTYEAASFGTLIYDIADPINPHLISQLYNASGKIEDIFVRDNYAFMVDSTNNKLTIWDITNIYKPVLMANYSTAVNVTTVYATGNKVYLGSTGGLETVDITTISSPTQNQFQSIGSVFDLELSGRYLFASMDTVGTIRLFDLASTTNPFPLLSITGTSQPKGLAIDGRYLYAASFLDDKLVKIDLTGIETTSAIIHSLHAGTIVATEDLSARNISSRNSLFSGIGGLSTLGSLSVSSTNTPSIILGGLYIGTTSPATTSPNFSSFQSSIVVIEATSSASVPLTLRGYGSQLGNLFQVQDSSNNNLFSLNSSGGFLTTASSTVGNRLAVTGLLNLFGGLNASSTATSTFAGGIQLYGNGQVCLPSGTCLGGGGGTLTGTGILNKLAYWDTTTSLSAENQLTILATTANQLGSLGIGSSTPYARLSILGGSGSTTPLLAVASSTGQNAFTIWSSGTTTIDQLQTGTLTFAPNAGISTLIDFGVDSGAANNTVEAYNLSIDASSTLTVWSRSDGSGGIKDQRIGLSTSTPSAELAIGAGPATTTIYLDSTGTKGSCIQMKSPNQTSYAVYVGNDGVLTATAGNCK